MWEYCRVQDMAALAIIDGDMICTRCCDIKGLQSVHISTVGD